MEFQKGMIIKMSGLSVKKENGVFEINSTWEKSCSVYKLKKDGSKIKSKYALDIFNYDKIEKYGQIITLEEVPTAITEINKQLKARKENEIVISYESTDKKEITDKCYIQVIKSIQTTRSIYAISKNNIFQLSINKNWNSVTWYQVGKKGELLSNYNGENMMNWSNKSMEKLFTEGYIEIVERVETARKDIEQEETSPVNEVIENVIVEEVAATQETIEVIEEDNTQSETQTSQISYQTGTGSKGNGIEITFENKPSEEVRNMIKAAGYRWGGKQRSNIWWAILSDETEAITKQLTGEQTTNESNEELTREQQTTLNNRLNKENVKPLRLFKNKNNSILLECINTNIENADTFYFIINSKGKEFGKGYNYPLDEYTLIKDYSNEKTTIENTFSYPEIEIDDNDNYTIPENIAKLEHEGHWIFRSEQPDHNKQIQEYFTQLTNEVKQIIQTTENEYIIYKLKKTLQYYKKHYHQNYLARLTNKSNNPSWVVTGRDGRNSSRDSKYNSRYDKLMNEYIELDNDYKSRINALKNKIHNEKKQQLRNNIENTNVNIEFKTETKEFTYMGYNEKKRVYAYGDYFICKLWNCFRLFHNEKEININLKTTDTLETAKKALSLYIQQQETKKGA